MPRWVRSSAHSQAGEENRTGEIVPSRPRHRLKRRLAMAACAALVPLTIMAGSSPASAQATFCWTGGPYVRKGDTTRAEIKQQAHNTWQDYVWRSSDIYFCDWGSAGPCPYTWAKTKSVTWQWSVGVILGGQNNPTTALLQLLPSFGRSTTSTVSFSSGVTVPRGKHAQALHVVVRRWRKGDFVGAFRLTGKQCTVRNQGVPNFAGREYYWDGNYRWGSWSDNIAVDDYNTIRVY
jgi:hypothetical protein